MYKEYSEPVRQLPPHRILALNRGESKNCLKLTLNYPADAMLTKLAQKLKIQPHTVWNELYTNAVADSYKRLLFPSLERELRNELTEKQKNRLFLSLPPTCGSCCCSSLLPGILF